MHNAARQREGGRAGAAKLLEVGCCCGGEEAHSLIAVADSLEEEDRNAVWRARCMLRLDDQRAQCVGLSV